MPCEYGPSATGALFVWIASFAIESLPSIRECGESTMRGGKRQCTLVLDFEARCDPRVDAAVERPHALEADGAQLFGNLYRRGFVRARTVDDDFAVLRHAVHAFGDPVDV